MDQLNISLENCYGIKELNESFDFSKNRNILIYAPNGFMKTSFAKTFMDLSKDKDSVDLVHPERSTSRIIEDENNTPLESKEIFVIVPYNESFKSNRVSTLLVNKNLKEKYDQILENIEQKKELLIKELKVLSGLKKNVEETFSEDIIGYSQNEFFKAILRIKQEVISPSDFDFSSIKYTSIFHPKIIDFLNTEDFKTKIKLYIETYDDLISKSNFFQKGVFNHTNAFEVAKNLRNNGFFKANHYVILSSGEIQKEISTDEELEKLVNEEQEKILKNPILVQTFEEIDQKLSKNKELREFREFLLNNPVILPELVNLPKLKNEIWISYLKTKIDFYSALEIEFSSGKQEIDAIISQAKLEKTQWINVINIFNSRFSVPFKIHLENQEDVMLKEQAPNFKFTFGDTSMNIEEKQLFKVLSNGEKRALYILNLLFEIEARKLLDHDTLFIIDDIADSFDYKNKYAIIEYLKDNSEHPQFSQIILTHNFDFFRTVQSRILGNAFQRDNSFIAQRNEGKITLTGAGSRDITNPFSIWKRNLDNKVMFVASIPFIRNLVEFREGHSHNDYKKLTSLLHIKSDTNSITIADVKSIYENSISNVDLSSYNSTKKVIELIFEACEEIISTPFEGSLNLENKITLSIGIRLKAEIYMWSKVTDKTLISGSQTGKLFGRYKTEFANDNSEDYKIKLCGLVNLMTPENIHLNSFMYEPILDLSNHHLKNLYTQLKTLVP